MCNCIPTIRIQAEVFDTGEELRLLRAGRTDIGAVASFEGICRDHNAARAGQDEHAVQALELEHYPGMTERSIAHMVQQAQQRWPLQAVTVIHRIGPMLPGDPIVFVAAASAHRLAAFEACAFLMDYLKTQAPFWKKESTPNGAQWVDAREADDAALARWGIVANNGGIKP
jgi:molybdopterin synthase catalytic subunit